MQKLFHQHERLGLFCLIAAVALEGGGDLLAQARGGRASANPVATAARVVAVADEHSNSIIASGSEDQLKVIAQILTLLDLEVTDVTEVRIFPLKNADPDEIATLLSTLFPDSTTAADSLDNGLVADPSVGNCGGGGAVGNVAGGAESERARKRGAMIAVAEPRTRSVVVSAARQLMPQIEIIVMRLDSDPARKRFVKIYQLKNSNTPDVIAVLRSVFARSDSTSATQPDALQTRADQSAKRQPTTSGLGSGSTRSSNTGGGSGNNR